MSRITIFLRLARMRRTAGASVACSLTWAAGLVFLSRRGDAQ